MPYQKPLSRKKKLSIFERWIRQGAKMGEHWADAPRFLNHPLPDQKKKVLFSTS